MSVKKIKGKHRDLPVGTRFGRLVTLEKTRGLAESIKCRCDCGVIKVFRCLRDIAYGDNLLVKSCGCSKIKHGASKNPSPEYVAWNAMKGRCANPRLKRYGERGITVCERWNDFFAFLSDMGPRPTPQHSLDRIDNDGPYSPDNCRWATKKEQSRNRGNNRLVEWNGTIKTLAEWAEITGHPWQRINARILAGWSVDNAMTVPVLAPTCGKGLYKSDNKA